jgi:hypothetical protein
VPIAKPPDAVLAAGAKKNRAGKPRGLKSLRRFSQNFMLKLAW